MDAQTKTLKAAPAKQNKLSTATLMRFKAHDALVKASLAKEEETLAAPKTVNE